MSDESHTLIVRHLPSELTPGEQEDLLKHFGASSVRTMGNKGRMKHIAFATFPDRELATAALGRLHQLEILGTRLVVEFSSSQQKKHHPMISEDFPKVKETKEDGDVKGKPRVRKEEVDLKKVSENVNSIAQHLGVVYAMDPRLEYMYPPPSVSILTNIANTLASVPKFYVQVLHLMNKMNLPAPFGAITPTPILPEGEQSRLKSVKRRSAVQNHIEGRSKNMGDTLANDQSTEESELESEEEEKTQSEVHPTLPHKRQTKSKGGSKKKRKLMPVMPNVAKSKTNMVKPSEVFEQPGITASKKIAFNLSRFEQDQPPPVCDKPKDSVEIPSAVITPLPGAPPLPPPDQDDTPLPPPDDDMVGLTGSFPKSAVLAGTTLEAELPTTTPGKLQPIVVEGGFGKIEPVVKDNEETEEDDRNEEWDKADFISSRELRKGRLSSSEKKELSVFRKYDEGEPSTRLYIKNIGKQVTEKDLHYIFGRYVDWDIDEHSNMFDIRLMKEGRMKGQAFVTLPSVKRAIEALKDTNGFVLQNKPLVVHFARSAKPKDDQHNASNGK